MNSPSVQLLSTLSPLPPCVRAVRRCCHGEGQRSCGGQQAAAAGGRGEREAGSRADAGRLGVGGWGVVMVGNGTAVSAPWLCELLLCLPGQSARLPVCLYSLHVLPRAILTRRVP